MPEVSRNRNIGEIGANMNAATFKKFLGGMAWAQELDVNFGDLSYVQKEAYEAAQAQAMAAAELWQGSFGDAHFKPGQARCHANYCMLMACGSSLMSCRVSTVYQGSPSSQSHTMASTLLRLAPRGKQCPCITFC